MRLLHAEPELEAVAEQLAEPQCHFGRHRALLGQDLVQGLSRDTERFRGTGERQADSRQQFLAQ